MIKNNLFLVLVFFGSFILTAQDKKMAVTLAYPYIVSQEERLVEDTGILDFGFRYLFFTKDRVHVGVSANGVLSSGKNDLATSSSAKNTSFLVQPRIFGALDIDSQQKLQAFLSAGYSVGFYAFKSTISAQDAGQEGNLQNTSNTTAGGIGLGIGASYNINETWFSHLQYDYNGQDGDTRSGNISYIKLGVGYRF